MPASSAPPKRIPSARPSRNVPNAARNSFKAATNASESQNGSTYEGTLNGENTADCALPMKGRPPIRYGFQSGTSGKSARVASRNGWNTTAASPIERFEPSTGIPAGTSDSHGADHQM